MPAPAAAAGATWVGAMVTGLLGLGVGVPFDRTGENNPDESPGIVYVRPRILFSWEQPPLAYGEPRSTRKRGQFIPELELGSLIAGDGFDVYLGAGARLQLDMSQYRVGWLGLSMQAAMFVAARGAVMGDGDFTPLGELAVGEHWWWNTRRFTLEASVGVIGRDEPELSAMLSLGAGWGL